MLSFLNVGSLIVVYSALLSVWGFKRALSVKFACFLAKFRLISSYAFFEICEIDLNRCVPFYGLFDATPEGNILGRTWSSIPETSLVFSVSHQLQIRQLNA